MQSASVVNGTHATTFFTPCRIHRSSRSRSLVNHYEAFSAATPSVVRSQRRILPSRGGFYAKRQCTRTTGLSPVAIASTERATGGVEPPAAATTSTFASNVPTLPTKRITFGIILGGAGAAVIFAGGWIFAVVCCVVVFQCAQEYYGFITSQGISKGMKPPPPVVSSLTSLLCIGITWWTFATNGTVTAALAVASFALMSLQLLAVDRPRFSQLASSVFGLFYCGYLPSFWVKLRLMAAPALNSTIFHGWPVMLGGLSHVTVGLIATTMAVAAVVAADTGAYVFGKALGRTQLTQISPKKTVEGALGGLLCSILVSLGFWRFAGWPGGPVLACYLGLLVFLSSLFGDLIESVMKRDAEMKDAGDLIPGHGGLLDRFDSYIFTGAIIYFNLKFVLPLFGL